MGVTRPLIGTTCSSLASASDSGSVLDQIKHAYTKSIVAAGGIPVVLPNTMDEEAIISVLDRIDGILLTGGNDVHPIYYGQEILNNSVVIDGPRDAVEMMLIRKALRRDIPILAICRGIQALNVAMGGTLYQDLPVQNNTGIAHRQNEPRNVGTHRIRIARGSQLERIVGVDELNANSFHHQAIHDLSNRFTVSARTDDGVIEAMEIPSARFVMGVQFHPEEMTDASEPCRLLFGALIRASQDKKSG